MVYAEQLPPLVVELILRGVHVLRALLVTHRARPEAEHLPARIGEREHDPTAEAVVEAAVATPLPKPGRRQLLLAEPEPLCGHHHAVPGARRIADAELAQDLLAQTSSPQVLPRARRLLRLPQHPLVVRGGPLHQLEQPLPALAPLLRLRVLLLTLQLDVVALGERLDRLPEVEPLGGLHELDRIARLLAAEAVVDPLLRVDAERRRALVVERTQPLPVRPAGATKVRAGADQLDHVDGVLDPLDRLLRVAHGAEG